MIYTVYRHFINRLIVLISVNHQKQPPEVFCKKGVLRNFAYFTGKHLCQSLFFNKVSGLGPYPARQKFNNYLELSKENVLGNIVLSYWPCFTWKFFMIWFHKILNFSEAAIMSKKYMHGTLKKTTYFYSFLGNFLIP